MDLLDVTVGDETRAGFSISFWLVPVDNQRKPTDDLRKVLCKLRTGDVVSLKNAALACWKGCVFGQSLSRRFARNSVTIGVIGDSDVGSKAERVKTWTSNFVGVSRRVKPPMGMGREREALPSDTQD